MWRRLLQRKPRLDHADPERRCETITQLSGEQAAELSKQLTTMAQLDEDIRVRQAAVAKIDDPNVLGALLDDEDMANSAAQRCLMLLESGVTASAVGFSQHPKVLALRLSGADLATAQAVFDQVEEHTNRAELLLSCSAELREQLLTQAMWRDEASLTVLERASRGRNKTCNRFARAQLEQLKQTKQQVQQAEQRLAELDAAIRKELQQTPADVADLKTQRQKLNKLAQMRDVSVTELEQAQQALRSLDASVKHDSVRQSPLDGHDLTVPEAANDPYVQLTEDWQELAERMREGAPIDAVTQTRDDLTKRWLTNADHRPPSETQHQVFERVSRQYGQYSEAYARFTAEDWSQPLPDVHNLPVGDAVEQLQRWTKQAQRRIKQLRWPEAHIVPIQVRELTQQLDAARESLHTLDGKQSQLHSNLKTLLTQTEQAIEQGQSQQAHDSLREAREINKQVAHTYDKRINQLSARLNDLSDWRRFATVPKRQALVDQMQSLADAPKAPPEQATELKALRKSWQSLGRIGSAEDAQLQTRFDQLAEIAFAPCREYYDEQAQQRANNLAQRQQLCQQLQEYLSATDWDNADIKASEQILRTAREAWHQYHPCDRKALKPVQDNFEQLQDQLHSHIKTAWDKNIDAKRQIIESAQSLLELPLDQQINGAKQLQQQWRVVGPTPKGPDQRLWREFRGVCDAIFERRDQATEQQQAEKQAQRDAIDQAIQHLTNAAQQATAETASNKTLDELTQAVTAAAQGMRLSTVQRQQMDDARQTYQQALAQAANAQALAQIAQWQQWDEQVSLAEQRGQAMEPPHPAFANRDGDFERLRDLTLEAEIAADLPSPAEDQPHRMALQVKLMNAGVRHLDHLSNQDLIERWSQIGPKDVSADPYRQRFFAALTQRMG